MSQQTRFSLLPLILLGAIGTFVTQPVLAESGAIGASAEKVEVLAIGASAYETFEMQAVADEDLSTMRGASGFSVDDDLNLNLLDAVNAHNSVNGGTTGSNIVNADAFTNTQGLVSLIQNSGNNVIIQSATIVNLELN